MSTPPQTTDYVAEASNCLKGCVESRTADGVIDHIEAPAIGQAPYIGVCALSSVVDRDRTKGADIVGLG